MTLADIAAAAGAAGLALRGAFHPGPEDGVAAGTVALLGWTGSAQWDVFAASAEAGDGQADPLDRWSRRVVDALAMRFGARALYPFGGPPWHPFPRWAGKAEPMHASPLGILIHPRWGLWHAYRGALAFAVRLDVPAQPPGSSPCEGCTDKPCLTACPVGAFTPGQYDVAGCAEHLATGAACMEAGCLARLACPVGAGHRYRPGHAAFHMRAFRAGVAARYR